MFKENKVTKLTDVLKTIITNTQEQDEEFVEMMNSNCPVVCPVCGDTEFDVDDDPGAYNNVNKLCLRYHCTACEYCWTEQYDFELE